MDEDILIVEASLPELVTVNESCASDVQCGDDCTCGNDGD